MQEIVIKIPNSLYANLKKIKGGSIAGKRIIDCVINGTVLPKGHGRLIDADALIDTLGCSDRDIYVKACIEEDAPTIIEADRSEE